MNALARIVAALDAAGEVVSRPAPLPEITGVTDDSREVTQGTLFCAVEGTADDGHRYIPSAAERGAAALLVSAEVTTPVPVIRVRHGRIAAAIAAAEWLGTPGATLRIVGVTGTNGKSTTVALTRHLLNADHAVASIGTLGVFDGIGTRLTGFGSLTTPGPIHLQRALATLRDRGVDTVVMEASSHALDQGRLETLTLAAAVYTNLTHEHLDYHHDLQEYRAAKLKLSDLLGAGAVEVVNADDPAWQSLRSRTGIRQIRYGRAGGGDVRAVKAELGADGSILKLAIGGEQRTARVPLVGDFNVSNALAAAATAWGLGLGPSEIAVRLGGAPQVLGRTERLVPRDAPFLILRDYAHTPDALERVIAAVRPLTRRRLIVLFGAGGDRDRRKRPLMGAIVARDADLAIVTSDNPRSEDPDAIMREIEAGMGEVSHLRVIDRAEAIRQAVELLEEGDTLLLAGKGHETYQVIGHESQPFDEPALVTQALAERGAA